MPTQYATHAADFDVEAVRLEQLADSTYLVAPVALIREGVLNGGFVPFEEIARSVPGWNGQPVTVNHPVDEAGNFVSANSPHVFEQTVIGRVFNVRADEESRKMLGELWLHVQRVESMGGEAAQTVEMLQEGTPLEVSTGYFMHPVKQSGSHEGRSFSQIQTNLLPDHLAVLPNDIGACSVADGCGAPRANSHDTTAQDATMQDSNSDTANGGRLLSSLAKAFPFGSADDDVDDPEANAEGDCGCGCGGTSNCDAAHADEAETQDETPTDATPTTTTTNMDTDSIRALLIANTEFDDDEVAEMDDEFVSKFAALAEADTEADAGHHEETQVEEPEPEANTEDVDDVPAWAEDLISTVNELKAQTEAEEQAERDELIESIVANTDFEKESLDEAPTSFLRDLDEKFSAQAQAARPRAGVNYAGRMAAEPEANQDEPAPVPGVLMANSQEDAE